MQEQKHRFRHDSLQDTDTIQNLLKALTKGIARGELSFSDEDGEIRMQPRGLLDLKLTASKADGRNRVTVRITWQDAEPKRKGKKSLKVR
ncbi:MAG: amphi-Trp domain-containing protein [bacterium]|nr:amphi-Trp domain-containing protein [bacterium]